MDATHNFAASSDPYTVRGLLARVRNEENRRIKDVAALNFQLNKQKKINHKLESEAKLERDKRRFKENELAHLRLALDRAYETIDELEKRLGACKEYHVHTQELDKAEERHAVVLTQLLEKESQLLTTASTLDNVKKSNDALRREGNVLKAKYEQLMHSENELALEVRQLQADLKALKHANDRRAELVSSLNSSEREETIKTLLRLGKSLPRSRKSYRAIDRDDEGDDFLSDKDDCSSVGAVSL